MGIEYVSQEEIEAHKAAMQRMVEREQEAIINKRKMAIEDFNNMMNEAIKEAEEKMRQAIDTAQKAAEEAIEAAKEAVKLDEYEAEMMLKQKLLAMQRDFERLPLLRQVYHEAPDDVFELVLSKCSYVDDQGGLNAFRLVNKRCKLVVESQEN